MIQHKLFLRWLIYVVLVVFAALAGFHFDLIQFMLAQDRSRLTYVILTCYVFTEIYLGVESWRLSRELLRVEAGIRALSKPGLAGLRDDGGAILLDFGAGEEPLPDSALVGHVRNLLKRRTAGRFDQQALLVLIADKALSKSERGVFMADIITLLGLLGTMVGLIMAFLPFFKNEFDLSRGQEILTFLFTGVSTAFFTTAAAIAISIVLRINAKHLEGGVQELLDGITAVSETTVIPCLERMRRPAEGSAPAAAE